MLDTARIADSPGLMIAVKFSTSSMPMFEMVKVEPLISSGARPPARALSMSCFGARAELGHRHLVGVADDRDDQTLIEVDRDAQMHAAMPADAFCRRSRCSPREIPSAPGPTPGR